MPPFPWRTALVCLVVLFGLCACGGNYRFNDDDYRPWASHRRSIVVTDPRSSRTWN